MGIPHQEYGWMARRRFPQRQYAALLDPEEDDCGAPVGGWRNSGSKLHMAQELREQHNGEGRS